MIKVRAITGRKSLDQLFEDYSSEKSSIEKDLMKGVSDKERETELKKRLEDLKVRLIPGVISEIQAKRKVEN